MELMNALNKMQYEAYLHVYFTNHTYIAFDFISPSGSGAGPHIQVPRTDIRHSNDTATDLGSKLTNPGEYHALQPTAISTEGHYHS